MNKKNLVFLLVYLTTTLSQAEPSQQTRLDDAKLNSLDMVQRSMQYEIMLGSELGAKNSVCIDRYLSSTWMLPMNHEAEISEKSKERLRRAAEICQVEVARQGNGKPPFDVRLAGEVRSGMEAQLHAAQELQKSKESTRFCLSDSNTQEAFKTCMASAFPDAIKESRWFRWISLFERRSSLASLTGSRNSTDSRP